MDDAPARRLRLGDRRAHRRARAAAALARRGAGLLRRRRAPALRQQVARDGHALLARDRRLPARPRTSRRSSSRATRRARWPCPTLAAELPVPVIGVIESGARAAAERRAERPRRRDRDREHGAQRRVHARAARAPRRSSTVVERACPLFVPLVEEGWIDHPVTRQVAARVPRAARGPRPRHADPRLHALPAAQEA